MRSETPTWRLYVLIFGRVYEIECHRDAMLASPNMGGIFVFETHTMRLNGLGCIACLIL